MLKRIIIDPSKWVYLLSHLVLAMFGFMLFQSNDLLWQGVGVSLIAAGITGWVIFIYIMQYQGMRDKLEILSGVGFVNAFQTRGTAIKPAYDDRLSRARERIDVLGFGQRALREDYLDEFANWKARARIRVLLLDPEFPSSANTLASQRDLEEHNQIGTIKSDVMKFVSDTAHLVDDRFQIKLYRCLPSVNIFRVDDEIFWGPYLMGKVSRNTPTFVVARSGSMFQVLESHFELVWNDESLSRAVPDSWTGTD